LAITGEDLFAVPRQSGKSCTILLSLARASGSRLITTTLIQVVEQDIDELKFHESLALA
jgi:hypothetical protein